MPKMKTRSGAKKRFHRTGTGKIKRAHAYHSHILTSKTHKRKRNLRKTTLVSKQDHRAVSIMLQN
jgi:large subunit ribosomal protein L35